MKFINSLLALFFTSIFIISCKNNCHDIYDSIISKYSPEEINYFYETVFYTELPSLYEKLIGEDKYASKWYNSVDLYLINAKKFEITNVISAIENINSLNIPIKYSITNNKKDAELMIEFVDGVSFDSRPVNFANVRLKRSKGRITSSKIIMNYRENDAKAKGIVLEEMVQSLGILGDSYLIPKSIFYNEKFRQYPIQEIDKRIIELLYSDLIPSGLTKDCFEQNFDEELHLTIQRSEFNRLALYNNLDLKLALESVDKALIDRKLSLFSSPLLVYIAPTMDSIRQNYIEGVLKEFENENLYFEFTNDLIGYNGLHFNLNINDNISQETEDVKYNLFNGAGLRPCRFRADIIINSKLDRGFSELLKRKIANAIFKCLGPLEYSGSALNSKMEINQQNKNIINFLYCGEIPVMNPLAFN